MVLQRNPLEWQLVSQRYYFRIATGVTKKLYLYGKWL